GEALNRGHRIPPWLAAWAPNIVLGAAGLYLLAWRTRAADQPMRFALPQLPFRLPGARGLRFPSVHLPFLGILDRYVWATYARIVMLSALGLAAVFYLAAFLDNVDRVFRGSATWD